MTMFFRKKFIFITIALLLASAHASAREMPYYASIKSDEANIRSGPSVRYPIEWLYKRENWPVQVTATFERWRKLTDINGEIGWIHESLLSGKRYAIVKTEGVQEIYRLPLLSSTKVFIVENGVIVEIKECKNNWCKIQSARYEGWIKDENLWGVDKGEVIK